MYYLSKLCMFTLFFAACALPAADGGATITPAPGFEPPQPGATRPVVQRPASMMRPALAYEVEQLRITPGDPAGLAAWAELAAQGFHLISVAAQDGAQVLFFERMRAPTSTGIRLPAALAADAALAQPLEATLMQILQDRQQAQMPQRPPVASPQGGK
jgi:hypothetical protein